MANTSGGARVLSELFVRVTLDLFTNNYRRNAFTIFNTDRADYVAKSSRPTRRERPIFVSENRSLSYVDRCWTSGAPEVCICVFIRTGVRPYVPSRAYTQEIGGGRGSILRFVIRSILWYVSCSAILVNRRYFHENVKRPATT